MTDFLPIKLGRNVDGVVTHLQEISSSDKIPEPFLQVSSNVLPNWNASGLQGFLVSSTTPSAGNALVWNAGINAWVPSTVTATGGGTGPYNASAIDGIPVDMPGSLTSSRSRIIYFDKTLGKIVLDEKNIYDPGVGLMTLQNLTTSTVVTSGSVSATGDLNVSGNIYHFGSFINVYDGDVNVSGAVISQTVSATTYENLPVSSVVWASANYAVFAGSATSSLNARYAPNNFDVTGNINTDTQVVENYLAVYSGIPAIPADSRFYVQGKSYLQGQTQVNNNLIVTGTVSANTVSATQYQNLPSSVIVWASANYAVFAGSATNSQNATNAASATLAAQATSATFAYFSASATTALTATSASLSYQATSATQALNSTNAASATIAAQATSATSSINAQQAPNGFNVTGTLSAPTISATSYLNIGNTTAQWNASALQGSPVSANLTPTANQSLVYNGSVWTASSITTGGGGGGGISDASSLRGSPLSATLVPTAGQALMYNGSVWTASAALFAYTYGSGAPTGGSDGDIYLQTDVVALQVPSVSATTYYNLPSGTLVWAYATSATSALYATNATSATLALNATSATSALNARQAPAGFDVTGMLTAASGDVSSTRLTDYSEKKSSPTISSSALTLDLTNSQVFTVALNSNISTLTISNPDPRTNTAQGFTLILTADGTARTISWPGSVKWPSGTGPTLTSTNNKVDILSFLSPDNGTTWYGFTGGQNF